MDNIKESTENKKTTNFCDKPLKVTLFDRRMTSQGTCTEMSMNEFYERVKNPKRTKETRAEYEKMSKEERDALKDSGGYMFAECKDGKRDKDSVITKTAMVFDFDHIGTKGKQLYVNLEATNNMMLCHTTRNSVTGAVRVRSVTPFSKPIPADKYEAISKEYAKRHGFYEYCDPCSFLSTQMMFWPTASSDQKYYCWGFKGDPVDPDQYYHEDVLIEDTATKINSTEDKKVAATKIHSAENKKVAAHTQLSDPKRKKNIEGAYTKAHNVQWVIKNILSEIYAPTNDPKRFDFRAAEAANGLVLLDDDHAFSHHATDPAYNKVLTSYRLVQIHLFGEGPIAEARMKKYALSDPAVRREFFSEDLTGEGEWLKDLEISENGLIKATLSNITLILRNDSRLQIIRYNLLDLKAYGSNLPWITERNDFDDYNITALRGYIEKKYKIYSKPLLSDALRIVAMENSYHPVREYLESLPPWDGVQRLDTLLVDYLGAEDNQYVRAVARKTLVAAIARVYEPGIKFDYMLVLMGPQAIGKSTLIQKLAIGWYSDNLSISDMGSRNGAENLQGCWIIEIPEMEGMRKTGSDTLKAFVSRTDDRYRIPYDRNVSSHPRQCILIGTSNEVENGILRDETGNRRFWLADCKGGTSKTPWDLADPDIGQIWAEALVMYRSGEALFMDTPELVAMAADAQNRAMETDDREGMIRQYLDTLLPDSWDDMSIDDRRRVLEGNGVQQCSVVRTEVTNIEIWTECLRGDPAKLDKADSTKISRILKKIGWVRPVESVYTTSKLYGRQRKWVRPK